MSRICLSLPANETEIRSLKVGDIVYLSGPIYTARDMAHLRMKELYQNGTPLPITLSGAAIFHAGPVALQSPDGNWRLSVIGPTTSIRMEPYADFIGALGVRILIGKGGMGEKTREMCKKCGYVYLQAAPGCAALLAKGIQKINSVTWLELGIPEAIWGLEAAQFGPLVVGMDSNGNSIYDNVTSAAYTILNRLYMNTED